MDLIRTLLVYMAMLMSTSAVSSPALTPLPPNFATPSPSPTVTMQATMVPATSIPTLTPTAAPTRTPTLAMGDRGENVRVMQVRLQELGYLTGRVDSIFGKQTKQALERFQRYNNLSVDGIAGPQTNQKLFNDRNAVRAPAEVVTPQPPVLASVPVYYRNSKGVLLGSDTVLVAQGSFTIRPNARLIPANHSLISQSSVSVRVDDKGRATPASVTFTYQANSEVTPVVVPVFYRTDNNITLATDSISVMPGQTLTFTADTGRVPSGYTLITSGRLTVSVSNQGVATPGTLTFIYKKDIVNASISVNYRDTGGALLGQEIKVFGPGNHTISANNNAVPSGYTLQGANSQQVAVSNNGTASPNTITFIYKTTQVTVQVPIEYIDQADSSILFSDVTSVISGQSVQVTADNRRVPADYVLTGSDRVTVQVTAQGAAVPQKIVFTYRKLASAQIDVLYKSTDGDILAGENIRVTEGANTITASDSGLAGWIRQGTGQQTVTVSSDGIASPNEVIFLYVKEVVMTPTAAPTTVPTAVPTAEPTAVPTSEPTVEPTAEPTPEPTAEPTAVPTFEPTTEPTVAPTAEPSTQTGFLPEFVKTQPNPGNYPVYTGPGEGYYRVGNATLGSGTIRVYGQENDWALIGYGLSNGGYRIGFVAMSAVPPDVIPQALQLTYIDKNNLSASLFVDDPIVSENRELSKRFEGGSPFKLLAYLDDFWAYVEVENFEGTGLPARGFVSRRSLGV